MLIDIKITEELSFKHGVVHGVGSLLVYYIRDLYFDGLN